MCNANESFTIIVLMKTVSIRSKLPHTKLSIFSEMSALAHQYGAINLSQGYPDFDVSHTLIQYVHRYMKKGFNQYAPMAGDLKLRENIAFKIDQTYQKDVDPESEITITAGATQAIYTAITSLLKEGDEVIVFDPAYDSYIPAIELVKAIPIRISLRNEDFSIPWDEVIKKFSMRVKMIILNSPHNPTGSVLSDDDIEKLRYVTQDSDTIIVSDEVYEHIIFDQEQHRSILQYPDLYNRSIVSFSFGKTFHATGWKVGYAVAPMVLMNEFRKVHQFNVFSVNHPVQKALADYIENPVNYEQLASFYQNKRDLFLHEISSSKFTFTPCKGTYFQLLNYEEISDDDDVTFAKKMVEEFRLATIPISVFYKNHNDNKQVRVCFAKQEDTLLKAAKILCRI